jgi:hypothetical protein
LRTVPVDGNSRNKRSVYLDFVSPSQTGTVELTITPNVSCNTYFETEEASSSSDFDLEGDWGGANPHIESNYLLKDSVSYSDPFLQLAPGMSDSHFTRWGSHRESPNCLDFLQRFIIIISRTP